MLKRKGWDPVNSPLLEKETRAWVQAYSKLDQLPVAWQEPRSGGTMGAPDCWLPSKHGGRVGIELKLGWPDEGNVCFTMRPAQIRYHHVAAKAGDRTAILVSVVHMNKLLWRALLPGNDCPKSTDARVHCSRMLNTSRWDEFLTAINCDLLWQPSLAF